MFVIAELLPDTGEVFSRRSLDLGREFDTLMSAVLVTIPPNTAFPLHVHSESEDFFVLVQGDGVLKTEDSHCHLRTLEAVWVPAGHPHGLSVGENPVLDLGFQAPPEEEFTDVGQPASGATSVLPLLESVLPERWSKVALPDTRRFQIETTVLRAGQEVEIISKPSPSVLAILRGTIRTADITTGPCVATLGIRETVKVGSAGDDTLLMRVSTK